MSRRGVDEIVGIVLTETVQAFLGEFWLSSAEDGFSLVDNVRGDTRHEAVEGSCFLESEESPSVVGDAAVRGTADVIIVVCWSPGVDHHLAGGGALDVNTEVPSKLVLPRLEGNC